MALTGEKGWYLHRAGGEGREQSDVEAQSAGHPLWVLQWCPRKEGGKGQAQPAPPYSLSSPCPTLVPHLRERVCIFAGLASASKYPVISACAQMAHLACGSRWAAFLLFNYWSVEWRCKQPISSTSSPMKTVKKSFYTLQVKDGLLGKQAWASISKMSLLLSASAASALLALRSHGRSCCTKWETKENKLVFRVSSISMFGKCSMVIKHVLLWLFHILWQLLSLVPASPQEMCNPGLLWELLSWDISATVRAHPAERTCGQSIGCRAELENKSIKRHYSYTERSC